MTKQHERKWDREEVVILVTEYFKWKDYGDYEQEESLNKISSFLRDREVKLTHSAISDIFRNYAGIRMQTARVRCADPQSNLSGMQPTKLQKQIVTEYLASPVLFIAEAEQIIKKYS